MSTLSASRLLVVLCTFSAFFGRLVSQAYDYLFIYSEAEVEAGLKVGQGPPGLSPGSSYLGSGLLIA